jgi:hypothetical protein
MRTRRSWYEASVTYEPQTIGLLDRTPWPPSREALRARLKAVLDAAHENELGSDWAFPGAAKTAGVPEEEAAVGFQALEDLEGSILDGTQLMHEGLLTELADLDVEASENAHPKQDWIKDAASEIAGVALPDLDVLPPPIPPPLVPRATPPPLPVRAQPHRAPPATTEKLELDPPILEEARRVSGGKTRPGGNADPRKAR